MGRISSRLRAALVPYLLPMSTVLHPNLDLSFFARARAPSVLRHRSNNTVGDIACTPALRRSEASTGSARVPHFHSALLLLSARPRVPGRPYLRNAHVARGSVCAIAPRGAALARTKVYPAPCPVSSPIPALPYPALDGIPLPLVTPCHSDAPSL